MSHSREAVRAAIASAFRRVTLGKGISLRQAQAIDDRRLELSREAFAALAHRDIVDDWSRIPLSELDRDCVAHLDAEGFRYYIPALMLSLLDAYDAASMRVIGTLGSLYPEKEAWDYHMRQYSLLTPAQRSAIAGFLEALPDLVELSYEDGKVVPRALRNYWRAFLTE